MGFRFYRRIRILPGIRLNISKSGVSTSIGRRGAWLTFGGKRGTRATVGIPGTGLSYTTTSRRSHPTPPAEPAPTEPDAGYVAVSVPSEGKAWRGWLWVLLLVALIVWALSGCSRQPSDARELFEMQSTCGANARDWFQRGRERDLKSYAPTVDFANHFNRKLGRCFGYLTWSTGANHQITMFANVIDVNENNTVGTFMLGPDSDKPTRCDLEGKYCRSSTEWSDLVAPYLHE